MKLNELVVEFVDANGDHGGSGRDDEKRWKTNMIEVVKKSKIPEADKLVAVLSKNESTTEVSKESVKELALEFERLGWKISFKEGVDIKSDIFPGRGIYYDENIKTTQFYADY